MERTRRLLRVTLESLPAPPDATILLPHEVGRAVEEEAGAEVAASTDASARSPTERGLHHLESGRVRKEMNAEYSEPTGAAASDRAVRKKAAAAYDGYPTVRKYGAAADEPRELHHLEGDRGRQETNADYLEPTGRHASVGAVHQNTAAPDEGHRTVRKNHAALEERYGTDHHQFPQDQMSGERQVDSIIAPPASSLIGYTRFDPYMDLYIHGRPVCDFWETLWLGSPLLFHDRKLLSMKEYIAGCRKSEFNSDLTNEISSILDNHPGPISYFRLDSCSWNGGSETLQRWLQILSARRIEELIIVNQMLPTNTIFPVDNLQGPGLTVLCVAFMDIPRLSGFGAFNYCMLDTLMLTGCTYSSKGLQSLVDDCTCLRNLVLGCCQKDIRITSQSLMSIQTWNCTAASFEIEYAPKLLRLSTGIRPKEGLQSVMIYVNNVQALTEIRYLMLSFHDLTIGSGPVIQGVVALRQVRRIGLGIQMGNAQQRGGLISVMKHMPGLTHLILLSVEDSPTDQEYDDCTFAIESVSCVQRCLLSLKVEEFRAEGAEVAVITSIINMAGKLEEVMLELPYLCTAAAPAIEAATKLEGCPRASLGCRISVIYPE